MEEMLFITSHQMRKPVANILGIIEIINGDCACLSVAELKKRSKYFQSPAEELDGYVTNLNGFIEQAGQGYHLKQMS